MARQQRADGHERSYAAHRLVLASASCYFRGLFLSGLQSDVPICSTVEVANADDCDAFEEALEHIYGASIELTPANVVSLLSIADYLLVTTLLAHCRRYIAHVLEGELQTSSNTVDRRRICMCLLQAAASRSGRSRACHATAEQCLRYVALNTADFVDDFPFFGPAMLVEVLELERELATYSRPPANVTAILLHFMLRADAESITQSLVDSGVRLAQMLSVELVGALLARAVQELHVCSLAHLADTLAANLERLCALSAIYTSLDRELAVRVLASEQLDVRHEDDVATRALSTALHVAHVDPTETCVALAKAVRWMFVSPAIASSIAKQMPAWSDAIVDPCHKTARISVAARKVLMLMPPPDSARPPAPVARLATWPSPGMSAWYAPKGAERQLATLVEIHRDDDPPYATIRLDGDREKGVELSTLSDAATADRASVAFAQRSAESDGEADSAIPVWSTAAPDLHAALQACRAVWAHPKCATRYHKVFDAYRDHWRQLRFRRGWSSAAFELEGCEQVLDTAATITVRIRDVLDALNPCVKLRQVDGSARVFLAHARRSPNPALLQYCDQQGYVASFVRSLVHHSLRDANGYVEGLTEARVDELLELVDD
jgi:hypothetical protein